MSSFLDFVASFRLWADAAGLALLPVGFGLAGWFWWKARSRGALRSNHWPNPPAPWPTPPPLRPMSREDFEEAMASVRKLIQPHVEAGTPMALRAEREAIPDPRPGDKGMRTRKGRLLVVFEVADKGIKP